MKHVPYVLVLIVIVDAMLSLFLMLGLMLKWRIGLICWLGDCLVTHLDAQPRVYSDSSGCVLSSARAATFAPWLVDVMTQAPHALGTGQGMPPTSLQEFNRPIHDRWISFPPDR